LTAHAATAFLKEIKTKLLLSFGPKAVCAKCGARGRHIDVRPNWKEQPPSESLTGKQWR
jgi:hypothetical protein